MKSQILNKPNIEPTVFFGIVTVSESMLSFFEILKRVAKTEASVLIRGESGTGKEMVAHAIHSLGKRSQQHFEAINCATLTPDLLASELFGHKKGAFTGAVVDKKGKFELADKGTIFLDEVAEMPLTIQSQFLRVLQERVFTPVGSTQPVKVDIRFISATNKSLRRQVELGNFREDLMYRIRVVPLFLPPLVDREGDVEALLWHFIEEQNRLGLRHIASVDRKAFDAIMSYQWPGNVRELKNNIEHAFAVGSGEVLQLEELTPEVRGIGPILGKKLVETPITEREIERDRILEALRNTSGKKGEAAERLGMSRSTLWRKMREHKII